MDVCISKYIDLTTRYALFGEDGYYIDLSAIVGSLVHELNLGMSFNEIKEFVRNASIQLTKEEIQSFLNQKMEESNPGIKQRLEKNIGMGSIIKLTVDSEDFKQKIKMGHQRMMDLEIVSKYHFEPYSLYYFQNYISILKEKCIAFFEIFENLENVKKDGMSEEFWRKILDLDFHINCYGNLYVEDVVRLLNAMIYNIKDLYDKVIQGNNLETYLFFRLSEDDLMRNDIFENEIFPKKELQMKDLLYASDPQFIALSDNQIIQLHKERKNAWINRIVEEMDEGETVLLNKNLK